MEKVTSNAKASSQKNQMFPEKSAKHMKKQVGLKYLMFTENNTDVKIRMQIWNKYTKSL